LQTVKSTAVTLRGLEYKPMPEQEEAKRVEKRDGCGVALRTRQ
jgi:hypothetical protein